MSCEFKYQIIDQESPVEDLATAESTEVLCRILLEEAKSYEENTPPNTKCNFVEKEGNCLLRKWKSGY